MEVAGRARGAPPVPPRGFSLSLVGATWRGRVIACVGAVFGIGLAGLITSLATGHSIHAPLLAAPLGASAVLVFVLPASPISQPWPVIGGNTISALSGIFVTQLVHDPMLACGLAVGLAIAAMSATRTLHPPGGGMALTTVVGGSAIAAHGFMFALVPVCLNSILLAVLAWAFHKASGHSYPHVTPPAPALSARFQPEDIDAAIASLGETFDIKRADLDRILQQAELNARSRLARPKS